jgi:hypothetical protein
MFLRRNFYVGGISLLCFAAQAFQPLCVFAQDKAPQMIKTGATYYDYAEKIHLTCQPRDIGVQSYRADYTGIEFQLTYPQDIVIDHQKSKITNGHSFDELKKSRNFVFRLIPPVLKDSGKIGILLLIAKFFAKTQPTSGTIVVPSSLTFIWDSLFPLFEGMAETWPLRIFKNRFEFDRNHKEKIFGKNRDGHGILVARSLFPKTDRPDNGLAVLQTNETVLKAQMSALKNRSVALERQIQQEQDRKTKVSTSEPDLQKKVLIEATLDKNITSLTDEKKHIDAQQQDYEKVFQETTSTISTLLKNPAIPLPVVPIVSVYFSVDDQEYWAEYKNLECSGSSEVATAVKVLGPTRSEKGHLAVTKLRPSVAAAEPSAP